MTEVSCGKGPTHTQAVVYDTKARVVGRHFTHALSGRSAGGPAYLRDGWYPRED